MKKIIILIFFLISFSTSAKAFLGEDLGSNLYESIDEGIEELELKQYKYELGGQGKSIKENLNLLIKSKGYGENYFEKDFTTSDIEEIAINGNIGVIFDHIGTTMDNGVEIKNALSLYVNEVNQIQLIIENYYIETKNKAETKAKNLNDISRIGIYSDGNRENSPFDLISDLQDIDQIIFSTKIEYEGEEYSNNDNILDNLFNKNNGNGAQKSLNTPLINNDISILNDSENNTSINENNSEENNLNYINTLDSNCEDDYNKSGLDSEALNKVIANLNNPEFEGENSFNDDENITYEEIVPEDGDEDKNTSGAYKKVNDNSVWPCDNFFCITIEFITHKHNLLGGGPNISIEYLLNRSNSHLKKFAGTSLIQSKMPTNNFELGLSNPSLPDMFHLGFIIQSKPIPILNIEQNEEKKDSGKYTKDNLLEEIYKNNGLDYKRKNDLNIFSKKEKEMKTILDSADLPITSVPEKSSNLNQILLGNTLQDIITKKSVFNKVLNDELAEFEIQFIELRKFSAAIYEYAKTMESIIKKMDEIPTI